MRRQCPGLLFVLVVFASQLWPPTAAEGAPTPPQCRFDPALDGVGFSIISPEPGWFVDRMTLDAEGRLYINIIFPFNNGTKFTDRVLRYTQEGQLDRTWGSNGIVEVRSSASAFGGRVMAIDGRGRLWFARQKYPELIEVWRFRETGEFDLSFAEEVELSAPFGTWDPVGAMAAGYDFVVLGHGVFDGARGAPVVTRVSNNRDIASQIMPTEVWGGRAPFVYDLTVDGWVAGVWLSEETGYQDLTTPYAWHAEYPSHAPFSTDLDSGAFLGITSQGGTALAYGGTGDSFPGGVAVNQLEHDEELAVVQSSASQLDWFDRGVGEVVDIDDQGRVVGFNGAPGERSLFLGTLNDDLTVDVTVSQTGVAQALGPVEVRTLGDGTRMIAGYHDYENNELFLARILPPETGPPVNSSALADQITRLYRAYYLRAPDSGGLDYWTEQRASGVSISDVSGLFAAAPEFVERYGELSNADFVTLVYQNVLSRPPDGAGLQYWTEQLETDVQSRGQVMLGFSESAENIAATGTSEPHGLEEGSVARLYEAYFGRPSDAAGLCYWSRRMVGGFPLSAVSTAFAGSAEFAATYGSLDNRGFVELVYQNVLGRQGEADGVAFWTSELDVGRRTRGQVMVLFSESAEFILRTGTLPPR